MTGPAGFSLFLGDEGTTSSNLPIPDDRILPYAAIAPRDQDPWDTMRSVLRYMALSPAGQGYFPGNWMAFDVERQGKLFGWQHVRPNGSV